ncbi:hypothetical protein RYX36_015222 [Vicia faba]
MVDDVERESFVSWAVASPIGDPIEGLNHGLLHLDERFSEEQQFLILEQVQFLTVNDDSLLQWELVDVVDTEEEEGMVDDVERESFVSWAVASPIGNPIEGLNHSLLHLDDRFSEEQVRVDRDVVDKKEDDE